MRSSCAWAARIVATSSSSGDEKWSVGPQSGLAFARRARIFRARARRAGSGRLIARGFGRLGRAGIAEPYSRPIRGGGRRMPPKKRAPYRPFEYLEGGADYRAFELAKELDRVPSSPFALDAAQTRRLERILATAPLVSSHDHCIVMPEDIGLIHEYARERRTWTGYAGLAAAGVDVVLEAFLDGMGGWRWDDMLFDLGMRYSDIAHQDFLYRADTTADVERAKPEGKCALVATLECATMIEDDIDRIDVLYGFGVRVMGITYSESNGLGSGLREERDGGLTDLGRATVRRMNKVGMTIDVSHCGDQTSLDTIESSERPILITHAGARGL